MVNCDYAPIALFVYNRIDKAKKVIESLAQNKLAAESRLYIFSDGPKNAEDETKVNEVRKYINSINIRKNFYDVNIQEQISNMGLSGSLISGITEVINKHRKAIVVEDDLQLSPFFLLYMNNCLRFYENNKVIWSISGYTPNLDALEKYDKNVYLSYRAFSWGWGTWKDRWDRVDWDVRDYRWFLINPFAHILFNRGGDDLSTMLKDQMRGEIDSWAIRFCYSQYKSRMFTIAPKRSMTINVGLDSTGTHSRNEDSAVYGNIIIAEEEIGWCYEIIKPNRMVINSMKQIFKVGLGYRIRRELKYFLRKIDVDHSYARG